MKRKKNAPAPCPCGSGRAFDECCGPFLSGAAAAPTPEALMRSRYAAYALGDDGVHHFFRSSSEHQSFLKSQELYKND